MQEKTAFIIAGPNGSGKTTFTYTLLENSSLLTGTHINPDEILVKMGLEETKENYLIAFNEAENLINETIDIGKNILIETVFSSDRKLDLFHRLKKNNYFINMIYIATEDPDINILNVAERVKKGGHDVPIRKIIERYGKSIKNVEKIVDIIDCVIFLDNSELEEPPIILEAYSLGSLCFKNEKIIAIILKLFFLNYLQAMVN